MHTPMLQAVGSKMKTKVIKPPSPPRRQDGLKFTTVMVHPPTHVSTLNKLDIVSTSNYPTHPTHIDITSMTTLGPNS